MSNILLAVTQQNKSEFQKYLEGGWSPPKINQTFSGVSSDYSVWTEVVLRDWVEGLQLLYNFFPEVTLTPEVWEIALKNSSIKCIEFLWPLHGLTPEIIPHDMKKEWILALMVGMGEPWSPPHEIKDVLPVLKFLDRQGFDISIALSGSFESGDFRTASHSLFTRALFLRKWDYVNFLWPKSSKQWYGWPRINEVILHLINVITGDYKSLTSESHDKDFPEEEILMRWLMEFGLEWLEADANPFAATDDIIASRVYTLDRTASIEKTPADDSVTIQHSSVIVKSPSSAPMETSDVVSLHRRREQANAQNTQPPENYIPFYRLLSRPSQEKISPWFRLVSMLETSKRQKIWELWTSVLYQDQELSWLHELAMYPEDQDVKKIILLARLDRCPAFHKFWVKKSASGFSPHERWINMGGQADLVQAWVPMVP